MILVGRMKHMIVYGSILLGVVGCGSDIVCAGHLSFAIALRVIDSDTGNSIDSRVTVIWTRNGVEKDSVQTGTGGSAEASFIGVGQKAGVYDLVVRKEGYPVWTKNGISVGASSTSCDPNTVDVVAAVIRLP
jgi:hypothetical protein